MTPKQHSEFPARQIMVERQKHWSVAGLDHDSLLVFGLEETTEHPSHYV